MELSQFPRKGANVRRRSDGLTGRIHAVDRKKRLVTVLWETANGRDTRVYDVQAFLQDWEIVMEKKTSPAQAIFSLAFLMLLGWMINSCFHSAPKSDTASTPPAGQVPATKWDGNPSHTDCSPEGHSDPSHPGRWISNEDSDEPCVMNAPESQTTAVDPLNGLPPDADHCFTRGWGLFPDDTDGDRKCTPMRKARSAEIDRRLKIESEPARKTRWIDTAIQPGIGLDEFYELPGEDSNNACAEVTLAAQMSGGYTVSLVAPDGSERDMKEPTRHLAEVAAVVACGNGRRP